MALFKGETTKWEDIQIEMGNFAERPEKAASFEEDYVSTMSRADRLVKQDFVNDLLTPVCPDDELGAIRRSRLEQLKKQDQQATVRRITKENYQDEVTEGSKNAVIVVLMDRGGGNSFLESELRKLAREWTVETTVSKKLENRQVRFSLGDIDDLIGHEFPDRSLPFAVVYAHGSCQGQLQNATMPGIQAALLTAARLPAPQEDDEDDDDSLRREIAARRKNESDESDDDYRCDKGYSSTEFARNVLRHRS